MKTKFLLIAAAIFCFASCTKPTNEAMMVPTNENVASLKAAATPTTINFTETNLFPEGVVYDKQRNRFLVSSTTRGDIGIVSADGSYQVFIDDPALTSTTGLEIDAARKLLYVSNAPGSVGIYDLESGERVMLVDLAALTPGRTLFINDIALDPHGNAYVTNSFGSIIYKISTDGTATIFFQDPAFTPAPGQFGFNGIVYGSDHGGYLLVAYTSANQLVKIPIRDTSAATAVSLNASLARPDGLLLSKDGKQLIVVNNNGGANGTVLSFTTSNNWQSGILNSSFTTGAVFPSTATSDGKNVYVLYAYLNRRAAGQSQFTIQKVPLDYTKSF